MALPTTRVAVMGPAGKEFVYKKEMREMRVRGKARMQEALDAGASKTDAAADMAAWVKDQEAAFNSRYEKELMNPKEALSLGSISEIVMPTNVRASLAKNLNFYLSHYTPGPLQAVQREFH
jgi:acetyl-CoA carboxylase carboxyltransferase component